MKDIKLWGVFYKDKLVLHKIHNTPKEIFFPALFEWLSDAKEYALSEYDIRKVIIIVNKKNYNDKKLPPRY